MDKYLTGKMNLTCNCMRDCAYSQYSISVQDKQIVERTATKLWTHPHLDTQTGIITTDEMEGNSFGRRWYNMGRI